MDPETIAAYDHAPGDFADEWESQPPPDDLYALVRRWFRPGPTADIGCGSGRDTAWLDANGYECTGWDASPGLVAEAAGRHPDSCFALATLPDLEEVGDARFTNVLCETVIMHLPPALAAAAAGRLSSLLDDDGTLYLSWRVTAEPDRRDDRGRLYAALDPDVVRGSLRDATVVFDEEVTSVSSAKTIHRLVARRRAAD